MKATRSILCTVALALALSAVALNPLPASAQVITHRQALPTAAWQVAAGPTGQPSGIGQWIYVAPIPPAKPGQLSSAGYVYGPSFFPAGERGVMALSTDASGPIAGIQIEGATTKLTKVRYAWAPGRIYFLLAYHIGNGQWGGWVYDNAATVWTYIGYVQAAKPGLLSKLSVTAVSGAQGMPAAAFGQEGPATASPCSAFPRVDAYFYPAILYWDTTTSVISTVQSLRPFPGDCPTTTTIEQEWAHFQLGSAA